MKVRFFATLRHLTGVIETGEFTANTLGDLLDTLCRRYGRKFTEWVLVDGRLSQAVIVLVNGRAVEHLAGLKTNLNADDEVSIFPKIAGG